MHALKWDVTLAQNFYSDNSAQSVSLHLDGTCVRCKLHTSMLLLAANELLPEVLEFIYYFKNIFNIYILGSKITVQVHC